MKELIDQLNNRVIEINDKIENSDGATMENLASGRMMEATLMMQWLIGQGIAELDESETQLIGWMQIR